MLMLLLIGCPFIFGPPDLSGVGHDSATTPDSEPTTPGPTGTTGTTAITGDTGPIPIPPEITTLTVEPSIDGFTFSADIEDADADMSGGDVVIEGVGPPVTLAIPEEVVVADGQVHFVVPAGDPCTSWDHTFDVVVHDAAGNPSPVFEVQTSGSSSGTASSGASVLDLGQIVTPWAVCGSTDSQNELDQFLFSVATNQTVAVSMTWSTGLETDMDFDLYQGSQLVVTGASVVEPEIVFQQIMGGMPHRLDVRHYSGPRPALYQVLFLPVE